MGVLAIEIPSSLKPEYLKVLSETATLLLADAEPDEVCQAVFNRLSDALGLDAYFHYLVSADGSDLRLQSCRGVPDEERAYLKKLAFGQAVCGTVAALRQHLYVPGVQDRADDMTELIRGYGIQCYVCFPLMAGGQLLGTFSFGTKRRSTYTSQEIELIHLVCQQIAIAVQRRRTQEELRRVEKLAATGQLAATIAHEVNNPLAAAGNLLYLLRNETLSPQGREFLDQAENEITRAGQVSKQILQFYRENAAPVFVLLKDVVADTLRVLDHKVRDRGISVHSDVPDNCVISAVKGELVQVLTNLVSNAVDASATGGVLDITARRDSHNIVFTVADHGAGIPAEIAAHIFDPFFTTKKDRGTGLGLWVAKQLVEKNGGFIGVESRTEPPSGSSFTLTFAARN